MGALPKKRISRERQGKRRQSIKLETVVLVKCQNCGTLKISHTTCTSCGFYKNRVVKKVEERTKVKKVSA